MYRKLVFLISVVLVLGLAESGQGAWFFWTDANDANSNWNTKGTPDPLDPNWTLPDKKGNWRWEEYEGGRPWDDPPPEIINQGDQERTIQETLDIGWRVLSLIPKSELRRINKDLISRYFSELMEDGVKTPFY